MKASERIYWIAALVLLFGITAFMVTSLRSDKRMLEKQISAKNSENVQFRNKYNELQSETVAFEGTKKQIKQELEYWKRKGDTLRTKYTSSLQQLTHLKKVIEINGTGDVVQFNIDTIYMVGPTRIDKPTIAIDTTDALHAFKFGLNAHTWAYQIKVFDQTEILTTDEGKSGIKITTINRNPYVISSEAPTVVIPRKRTPFIKKVAYVGAGFTAGFLLFKKRE